MARRTRLMALGLSLLTMAASPTRAASPDEIDAAIRKGIDYLYARPEFVEHGNWEFEQKRLEKGDGDSVTGPQWGGRTALITYALLAAGESPSDPRLKRAIDFLKKSDDMIGYYALGLRPHVWMYLPPGEEVRSLAMRDFKALWAGVEKNRAKPDAGLYDYTLGYDRDRIDMSVSQYGAMGMWACAQLGVEIPNGDVRKNQPNFWSWTETAWRAQQDKKTGGWAYGTSNQTPNAALTAAGITTLLMAHEYRGAAASVGCSGNPADEAIDRAIAFLEGEIPKLFSDDHYPDRLYSVYAIERVQVVGGLKYFGKVDWFATGADWLVKEQARNGSWTGGRGGQDVSTAFAILFLSRGRDPVMINKLKYDLIAKPGDAPVEGFWNQRMRDVANATHFVSRQTERPLNWQIIDMSVAGIGDLRDAPIAYVSGSQALKLTPDQVALLKRYVEEGGMLVFNADCARPQFARSIPALLAGMFPGTEFKPLPDSHPIYRNQQFRPDKWKRRPGVQGLSNGVREVALIFDEDVGKSFQTNDTSRSQQHFELMTNIYQYAIDKTHARVKGRVYAVEPDPAAVTSATLRLARLQHGGRWDPEPGGWRRLGAILRNTHKIDLQVQTIDLEKSPLEGVDVAHLTGVGAVKLSDAAIAKLKAFVEAGGLLLVDAAGGNAEFATAIEAQLGRVLESAKDGGGPIIPPTDPLFQSGGLPVPEVRYRAFAQATVGSAAGPRLRGAKVGDRYGLIYSSDDLSAGLVGNDVDGIRGYAPESATQIMIRLLRYAQTPARSMPPTSQAGSPTSRPATAPAR